MNLPGQKAQHPPLVLRDPPHSVEAEMGVLSSMLQSPRQGIAEAVGRIDGDFFYVPANRTIFETLRDLWEKQYGIDLLTFTQVLRDRNLLDGVGGAYYVTTLQSFLPTAANLAYYLDIVREKHILREIIRTATDAVRRAYEDQDDPNLVLDDYQANAIEIGQLANDNATSCTLAAVVPVALKDIKASFHARGHCTGISTGFVDLDRTMNGFEAPLTYYFAARPAMGKSALMLKLAYNIAVAAAAQCKRIKIFSVEMTGRMLAKRLICMLAEIHFKRLRPGQTFVSDEQLRRAEEAADELTTDYVHIDEKGDLSIHEFRARARQAVAKNKCELIMIDYLQRMKGSTKRAQLSRELEINEIAQGISATAKELNVPIVVLAQLNRKPEERVDGKPELGDLRESGSIEQEARFVGLLWRPNYYATNASKRAKMMKDLGIEDEQAFAEYAECIVAKQNEGPVGPIPLRFIQDYARYESQDQDRPLFPNRLDKRQPKPASHGIGLEEIRKSFPERKDVQ